MRKLWLAGGMLYNRLRQTVNWLRLSYYQQLYDKALIVGSGFRLNNKVKWQLASTSRLQIGQGTHLSSGCYLQAFENATILIGQRVFFNRRCSLIAMEKITIGDDTLIGESVKMYDHNHRTDLLEKPIVEQGYNISPIIIGNNCWIGSNVVLLKGVTIGNNCVIGANTVVYKNVPNDTILLANGSMTQKRYR